MGYSAQVQQSPNQSSGKGNFQQFRDLMGQPSTASNNVAQANANPYQGTRQIMPQGNQGPIGVAGGLVNQQPNYQLQVDESGINSGAPRQSQGNGGFVGQSAPAYMSPPQQVGMSQADMGINSGAPHQSQGKGGNYSMSATSGQPQMGAPNKYPNTIGMKDNMQQQRPQMGGGKGKA